MRALVTLSLVVLWAAPASTHAQGLARVRASGVLRWGGDIQGGEPYVFLDPHDSHHLVGYEVEIADAVARELGVKGEFHQNNFSTLAGAQCETPKSTQ